jgi:hypothetical protein
MVLVRVLVRAKISALVTRIKGSISLIWMVEKLVKLVEWVAGRRLN